MRRLISLLLLCVLVIAVGSVATGGAAAASAGALAGSRLEFGLSNGPSDLSWMTQSGVPWKYRYQYIAGGVNTSGNWYTWQDMSLPPGQFALDYMNASTQAGYIPVFSWYELLQSSPSLGSTESDRDYSNLNNATTMNSYYASFQTLLEKAGSFGGTVVIHVEPDLWGYLQQRSASAGSGSAASLSASVASSGYTPAAGFPDTAQGFAELLLHMRDVYAPNAILAIHASEWASGVDIATDTSPSVSATTEADKTAAFLSTAGLGSNPYGSTWDLVFNDVDDHDAGWWEAQGADNASFTHWWDPANVQFPNFSRYLTWVAELHARTALPQIVWQVPLGNQVYLTLNNTDGHYQDNVAQYFITHPADLYQSGLIAVLFGAGNSGQTTNLDTTGDGVTNNNGVPTTDTAGWCSACNTRVSMVSDDDGGYIRNAVGAYYASSPPVHTSPSCSAKGARRCRITTAASPARSTLSRSAPAAHMAQSPQQQRAGGRQRPAALAPPAAAAAKGAAPAATAPPAARLLPVTPVAVAPQSPVPQPPGLPWFLLIPAVPALATLGLLHRRG